ncbi:galactoside alpha-(1,2)-fucosyltransferase 2-like [Anomaloglossus baeobatrachus]|uniref:galactoside alpha-(1,2)-fucosyltransferase 2-like n=1 Tax=Anomaloglossus baeobatrachus TaxID=238106 RepID=UPI003F5009CD
MKRCVVWTVIISLIFLILLNFVSWEYVAIDNLKSTLFHKTVLEEKEEKNDKYLGPQGISQSGNSVWLIESGGRLGSQMGKYATLYPLAKINGHQPYILPKMHDMLSPLFRIKLPVLPLEVANRMKWKRYLLKNWMLPEYRNISDEHVRFLGTPWSWTFYHHIRDEILREFTFHDYLIEEANEYLAKVRGDRKNVTFIGVHVRRADYVKVMPRDRKGVVADKGYMDKAMAYYRNKYSHPLFVVTSNGMPWCKENINASFGDVHFAGDGKESSPAHDFAVLAHCNHTIMTIGSFGFWPSYMAGGETIYLTNFTLPDSPMMTFFKYEAIYLPEWIGIPTDLSPLIAEQGKNYTGTV